ncbi:16S rRNA (cytosine(1402)-N(4))-methyltransferase RsmH [Stomatohabitans albus]|uniref:16S rRNA (cytosine(1402)-N(4))-methyltransferase RsmH n=1 Tax=Stomatohabitans albus TaxID=3110766 RepID=UPI00300C5FD3
MSDVSAIDTQVVNQPHPPLRVVSEQTHISADSAPNQTRMHPRVMASTPHAPVLVRPITDALAVGGDEPAVIVDCTLGAGGHALALFAASGKNLHIVGFDRDPAAQELAGNRLVAFKNRLHQIHAPFDQFTEQVKPILDALDAPLAGVLWDLGVSSMQLDTPGRGFSFRSLGPVDMRMDPTTGMSAADFIDAADMDELRHIIRIYGEEPAADAIARALVTARPFKNTVELAEVVVAAMPARDVRKMFKRGVHPATRTFQALRIAVNGELDRFEASLPQALDLLAPPSTQLGGRGGRLAILSYHSLEDRIAKQFIAQAANPCVCPPGLPVCGCDRTASLQPITRGAHHPTAEEISENPRARSAKLRIAERLEEPMGSEA